MLEASLTNIASIVLLVNIIVQITKDFIPIPTSLYTIILSVLINVFAAYSSNVSDIAGYISYILQGFIIAYISMYGYDTFYELKDRLGGNKNNDL